MSFGFIANAAQSPQIITFLWSNADVYNSSNTYNIENRICLGLMPAQIWGNSHSPNPLYNRVSTLSLKEAHELAQKLSEHISAPVDVHTELRDPSAPFLKPYNNGFGVFLGREDILDIDRSEDEIWIPSHLQFNAIKEVRKAIQFLNEHPFNERPCISTEIRANLDPYMSHIEEIASSQVVQNATPSQREFLRYYAQRHIDTILEKCANAKSVEDIIGTDNPRIKLVGTFDKAKLTRAILWTVYSRKSDNLLTQWFPGLKECKQSAEALHNCYMGKNLLGLIFHWWGSAIPSLQAQREILIDLIEEKLIGAFGEESTEEIPKKYDPMLVKALRRALFIRGHPTCMISDTSTLNLPRPIYLQPFNTTIAILDSISKENLDAILNEAKPTASLSQ